MSSRCWIGFEGRNTVYFYILPIMLLFLTVIQYFRLKHQRRYFVFALLIYIVKLYLMYNVRGQMDILGIINQSVLPITIYLILCMIDSDKESFLYYFVKWFGLLLIPGIIIYVATFFVDLPHLGIIQTHYGGDFYGEPCYNYLFYLKPVTVGATGMFRFNGPFIEPGDLGCIAAFCLYATKFDFKKYKFLWVILVALLCSFSLAGYLLTLFGYAANLVANDKLSITKWLVGLIAVISVIKFGEYYNGGNNYINNSILSRLQDDEMSITNSNGRLSQDKMEFFYYMFNDPNVLWFGYDRATVQQLNDDGVGAGFYNQMLSIGLCGVILSILPFLYFAFSSSCKKYSVLFFVFVLLYAYQRFDLFWISILLIYTYGISINEYNQRICRK